MNLDAIEDCLQQAAERSSAWALIKETEAQAWVLVLSDESLVDVVWDDAQGSLTFRGELGLVTDPLQRAAINELVLQCTGVIPMPAIALGADLRYEALMRWPVNLDDIPGLAALIDDMSQPFQLWRDVVARPLANAPSADMSTPTRAPAFGAFA